LEKVRLGRTEMMVSRLGFGGIPIQRLSESDAIAVVKRCLDLGINYLDTANAYTTSEERIGKAISERRKELIIATKSQSRNSDELKSHLQQSLKQLGVEYIDLYQFHNVSTFDTLDMVLAPNGPMVVIQEAKRAGLVKHIGVTSHQIDVAREAIKTDRFETIMFPFNFITCEPAEELIPLAREHDVGFIAMKPLAGGMLDNATLAFKYILQFPDVVPIPGIQWVHEIEEIVRVVEGPRQLTEAEQEQIQQLRDKLGKSFCRRCDYCQPCTAEIPISLVLDIPSLVEKTQPDKVFEDPFASMLLKASDCTECGDCEERCPYHLPIREMVASNFKMYEMARKKYQERVNTQAG